MRQLRNYADDRLVNGCIYCGGSEETREHVPSRVFLDAPLPENLPVVNACSSCNNSFSQDEEYLACLIEAAIAGSTDPDNIRRPSIANIFRRAPALRARIEAAKSTQDGQTLFKVEANRVQNVLVKLARGHSAFELSQIFREEPSSLWWCPIALLSENDRNSFDASHIVEMFGEVGTRGLQRMLVTQFIIQSENGEESTQNLLIHDWVDVQDGRYRYLAIDDKDEVRIKMVIAEYLACEVVWKF
ncbi:MAG: hypothetical protein IH588_06285 [Anaerolineales bacterium]|nr:hypothetical protein [Anaerolineales bacterium]